MSLGPVKYCPHCGSLLHKGENSEALACSSPSCKYVFFDNPKPVVAAIVELTDGRIILARSKWWPQDLFGLVSGYVEKSETPETAILREVKEELGLEGKIMNFIGNYSFFEQNQIIMVFHISAEGKPILGEEIAEVKVLPKSNVEPWKVGAGPAVKDWLEMKG